MGNFQEIITTGAFYNFLKFTWAKHREIEVLAVIFFQFWKCCQHFNDFGNIIWNEEPYLVGNRDSQDLQQFGRFGGAIWTSHCLSFSSARGSPGCLTSGFWWDVNNKFYYVINQNKTFHPVSVEQHISVRPDWSSQHHLNFSRNKVCRLQN